MNAGSLGTQLAVSVRVLPLRSFAGLVVLVMAPAAIVAAQGSRDLERPLTVGLLVAGAAIGYALDDPAGSTIAASPTPLVVRRLWRLGAGLAILAAAWLTVLLGWAAMDPVFPPGLGRAWGFEVAAASGLAVAIGATGQRRLDVATLGFAALVGSLLAVLSITVLATRVPWLPSIVAPATADRWLWVAVPAWAVGAWSSRDPARPAREHRLEARVGR